MVSNTTGSHNTAVGLGALASNTTADYNTAFGRSALLANTTGTKNVAVGATALDANTTANDNTAVGFDSLGANTTGSANTAVGREAMEANTTGANNTALGCAAAAVQTTASNNTAIGFNALLAATTGEQNTVVGSLCGDDITTGDRNTMIGYNVGNSAVGVDQEVVIGSNINGAGTNTVKIGTSAGNATLALDGSDTSWSASSDLRLKKDIADSTVGLNFIKDLRPVTFKWNAKNAINNSLPQYDADSSDPVYGAGKTHHGFIAQEVKTVIDAHSDVANGHNLWNTDSDGTQQVAQGALVPMLVKAIQEQNALIEALTNRITILEG